MREPIDPHSPKRSSIDMARSQYAEDFSVTISKNNHHRHPLRREYFNRMDKSDLSAPKQRPPFEMNTNQGDSSPVTPSKHGLKLNHDIKYSTVIKDLLIQNDQNPLPRQLENITDFS